MTPRIKVGVTLEGGGADGGRQIGALKALIESGYQPVFMSGSSIGGIISGVFMCLRHHENLSSYEAVSRVESFWEKLRIDDVLSPSIFSQPIPRLYIWKSLFNNKIDKAIINFLGQDYDISELPVSMTATDLKKADQIIIKNEMLSKASKMTANIPGIFEPVDGRYVDGGVSSNTPIKYLKDKCDKVIVIRAGKNKVDSLTNSIVNTVFRSWMVSIAYSEKFAVDYFRDKFDFFKVLSLSETGDSGILELTGENARKTIDAGYEYTVNKIRNEF
jgi:NTE family protein